MLVNGVSFTGVAGVNNSRPSLSPFDTLNRAAEKNAGQVFLDAVLEGVGYVPANDQQIPDVSISGDTYLEPGERPKDLSGPSNLVPIALAVILGYAAWRLW